MKNQFALVLILSILSSAAFAAKEPFVLEQPVPPLQVNLIEETRATKLDGGSVYESNREKIIVIQGFSVKTKDQFLVLLRQALQLKKGEVETPMALYHELSDAKKFAKALDITILGADTLKQNIGADIVDNFVQAVNEANTANSNISLTYWK